MQDINTFKQKVALAALLTHMLLKDVEQTKHTGICFQVLEEAFYNLAQSK